MKAKLIKPPSLREQLKTIAHSESSSVTAFSVRPSVKSTPKGPSLKCSAKQSKPRKTPRQKKSPQVTSLIEQIAQGIELLEEIFK